MSEWREDEEEVDHAKGFWPWIKNRWVYGAAFAFFMLALTYGEKHGVGVDLGGVFLGGLLTSLATVVGFAISGDPGRSKQPPGDASFAAVLIGSVLWFVCVAVISGIARLI